MSSVTIEEHNGLCLIKGEINFYSVMRLRKLGDRLLKKNGPDIVFDFRAVKKADSSGLALMLLWLKRAKKIKKTLHFSNVPRSLQAMATLYAVSPILEIG